MNNPKYKGWNDGRGPSPEIWADLNVLDIIDDPSIGFGFFDDFEGAALAPTITSQAPYGGRYKAYATSGASFGPIAAAEGVLGMTAHADADEMYLATACTPFRITGAAATRKPFWFEARVKWKLAAATSTGDLHTFIGLAEALTLQSGIPLGNADAVSNTGAMIGFVRKEDDANVLETAYADHATSWTAIDATAGTLASATWTKLGIKYHPEEEDKYGDHLSFYKDGVNLGTGLTNTEIAALTYLDVGYLGLVAACFADSTGTTSYLYLDWWRAYQLS